MLQSRVLRDVAREMNISLTTAFRWRHRFSAWLGQDVSSHLEGKVEMDETYFMPSQKGCRSMARPPKKRGEPATQRALSRDQICIFTARDRSNHCMDAVAGQGPVSEKWLAQHVATLIAVDSVVVSDELTSYQDLTKIQQLNHVVVKTKQGQRSLGAFHNQQVHAYQASLTQWVNGHFHGVATKYLNHYLWWKHELENKHSQSPTNLFKAATHQIPPLGIT